MPEQLHGGIANIGKVVRDGDVVLRPAPDNASTLRTLLEHLAAHGYPSPRLLGRRDDSTEIFAFIPGETSMPPYPHTWVRSDSILIEIGGLLRALHDTTGEYVAPADAEWAIDLADPRGGPVICHNDLCIENAVVTDGRVVGILDYDFAAPGRPVWDLAMTARYWVPLQDPLSAAASRRDGLDPFARVRLLADAYGADDEIRRTFTDVLMEVEDVALRFVLSRIDAGDQGFIDMWNDLGGLERSKRRMAWLQDNLVRFDEALAR